MPSATQHSGFVSLATRLINQHGRDMELVTLSEVGAAPTLYQSVNTAPARTETTKAVVGVQTKFSAMETGDLIRSDDLKVLVDSSIEPQTHMRLRDGGRDLSIINVEKVAPGTLDIIYKIQARV